MVEQQPNVTQFKNCMIGTVKEQNACRVTCTLDTCPLEYAYWSYVPHLPTNVAFGAVSFFLCMAVLIQGLRSRQFKMYTVTCFIGASMEVVGYSARAYAFYYPFSDVSFIIQLSCLTFAPAFFAAAIYFSLSRLITVIGDSNTRIKAKFIPRIFVTCDVLSLVFQAAGGAISAYKASRHEPPDPGNYTLIAGLSFQSLTLLIFGMLALDFAIRTKKQYKRFGESALNDDPAARRVRQSKLFRWLVISLAIAAFLVFERSVYRIAELSKGWKGALMRVEKYVVIWESVPVSIAGFLLCVLHPGLCLRQTKQRNSGLPTREECYRMESTTTSGISSFSIQKGGQVDIKTLEIMYDDENSSRGSRRYSPPNNPQYLHENSSRNRF